MQQETYRPIDIVALCKALWANKKIFLIGWPLTFVLACGIVLCIPRKYVSSTILAPEYDYISTENLRNIARSANVDIPIGPTTDAISPDLYPSLVESSEFMSVVFASEVHDKEGNVYTVFNFFRKEGQEEWKTIKTISKHIKCTVDRKTGAVTITAKAKDAQVAADMANFIRDHLQESITTYRTSKARADVAFYTQQVEKKKAAADVARNEYACYYDSHIGSSLAQVKSEISRLEDELEVRQAAYTAALVQLQAAEIKLQEQTPVFTVIQNASAPVRPSEPKRMIIVLAVMALVTILMGIYVFIKITD